MLPNSSQSDQDSQLSVTNLNNPQKPLVDIDTVITFFKYFSLKDGEFIYPRAFQAVTGKPCKMKYAHPLGEEAFKQFESLQQSLYNLYFVVNGQGDKDEDILEGRVMFYEHDQLPKDQQLVLWQALGLPEPTVQVDTGGKSIHNYWVLSNPIDPKVWEALILDLLAFVPGADTKCKNLSRVLRVAGATYIHKDGSIGEQSKIVGGNGAKYSYDDLRSKIPEQTKEVSRSIPKELKTRILDATAPKAISSDSNTTSLVVDGVEVQFDDRDRPIIPITELIDPANRDVIDTGIAEGSRNDTLFYLTADLLGVSRAAELLHIPVSGDPEELAFRFCENCPQERFSYETQVATIESAKKSNTTPSLDGAIILDKYKVFCEKVKKAKQKSSKVIQLHPSGSTSSDTSKPHLQQLFTEIYEQNLSGSALYVALSGLKNLFRDLSFSDLMRGYKERQQELDAIDLDEEIFKSLINKSKLEKSSINVFEMLPSKLINELCRKSDKLSARHEIYLMGVLVTLSSLFKPGTRISYLDFSASGSLNGVLIGDPSSGKSTWLDTVAELPLSGKQQRLDDVYKVALEHYLEDMEDFNSYTPAERRKQGIKKPKPPVRSYYYISGGTSEGIHKLIAENQDKGLLRCNDEGIKFFTDRTKYSKDGGDSAAADFNSFWLGNKRSTEVLKNSETVQYANSNVSTLLGIQPDKFKQVFAGTNDGDGQLSRMLMINQPPIAIYINPKDRTTSHALNLMLTILYGRVEQIPCMQFHIEDEDAIDLLATVVNHLADQILHGNLSIALRRYYGKSQTRILKLAMALHALKHCTPLGDNILDEPKLPEISPIVSLETVKQAIDLNQFFLYQAEMLYKELDIDSVTNTVSNKSCELDKILKLSAASDDGWISLRDITRSFSHRKGVNNEQALLWANDLVRMGLGEIKKSGKTTMFRAASIID